MTKNDDDRFTTGRPGRPPKSIESLRRRRGVTLMTDAEYEELVRLARDQEETVSAMVHQVLSGYLLRRRSQ